MTHDLRSRAPSHWLRASFTEVKKGLEIQQRMTSLMSASHQADELTVYKNSKYLKNTNVRHLVRDASYAYDLPSSSQDISVSSEQMLGGRAAHWVSRHTQKIGNGGWVYGHWSTYVGHNTLYNGNHNTRNYTMNVSGPDGANCSEKVSRKVREARKGYGEQQ